MKTHNSCNTTSLTRDMLELVLGTIFNPQSNAEALDIACFAMAYCDLCADTRGDEERIRYYLNELMQALGITRPLECSTLGKLAGRIEEHLEAAEVLGLTYNTGC